MLSRMHALKREKHDWYFQAWDQQYKLNKTNLMQYFNIYTKSSNSLTWKLLVCTKNNTRQQGGLQLTFTSSTEILPASVTGRVVISHHDKDRCHHILPIYFKITKEKPIMHKINTFSISWSVLKFELDEAKTHFTDAGWN